jgi:hypothetical protein
LPDTQSRELMRWLHSAGKLSKCSPLKAIGTAAPPQNPNRGIAADIRWLRKQLAELDDALEQAIRRSPLCAEKARLLRGVPGVGGCKPDRPGMRGFYIPKDAVSRRPAVAISNMPEALACGRECQQTHEISAYTCQEPYTPYNRRRVEQEVQPLSIRAIMIAIIA